MQRRQRPRLSYAPSTPDPDHPYRLQEAFHRSTHTIRALFPGNGWGKTTAIGAEVDAWLQGANRWQVTPPPPVEVVWVCPVFAQFLKLLPQLEREILTKGYSYNGSSHIFTWPNKSRLHLFSGDGDWKDLQGINPHLFVFDEEPPLALWREALFRRRGRNKTRFLVGATATTPGSWMEAEIFKPWLDAHDGDEEQAIRQQRHPDIWCLPRGGLSDNPSASDEDVRHYEKVASSGMSAKEKKVRLRGGFANWLGDCIFDEDAIEHQETLASDDHKDGGLEPDLPNNGGPMPDLYGARIEVITRYPFRFTPVAHPKGTLRVWERPIFDHTYVCGADFAYGIEGRDYDAAIVLDITERPYRQVAELYGHWGELFDRPLFAMLRWYNDAFLMGERQVGLPTLRRLYREYEFRRLYYQRDESAKSSPVTDKLGWPRAGNDITTREFRRGVIERGVVLRSRRLVNQMRRTVWYSPREIQQRAERSRDELLQLKLQGGGSPDLVIAAMYAYYGAAFEVQHFPKPREPYAEDTLGAILGHNEREGLGQFRGVSFSG